MANFAQINEFNEVINVIVVDNTVVLTDTGDELEELGLSFLKDLYGDGPKFVQTSLSGRFRKRFAGIGMLYDETNDAFIYPKPYESWVFNNTSCDWDPPFPKPVDGQTWDWNEESQQWIVHEYQLQGEENV